MNDEKMVTSLENQTNAGGSDPIPQAHANEDSAPFNESNAERAADVDSDSRGNAHDRDDTAADGSATEETRTSVQDHLSFADPLQTSGSDPVSDPSLSAEEQLGMLQCELKQIREELAAAKVMREDFCRIADGLRELQCLYPEVSLSEIPDEVYEGMGNGIPPAASYALYLKREREKQREAARVNDANRQRSSGSLVTADADYFSPAEVRAMSQSEVRKNYQKIMQSMQKWH